MSFIYVFTANVTLGITGTGANIVRTPDTQTKVEGMKIDNELSDLSND